MITTNKRAVTDAASKILGKERQRKIPGVTRDVLDFCDQRRNKKKKQYEAEEAKIQWSKQEDSEGSEESNGGLDRCSVLGDWILLEQKNRKRIYQLVKDLTSEKQDRSSTIQDRSGKCLIREEEILSENVAQNCTTIRVVVTSPYWTAVSPRRILCNQFSVRKMRLQLHHRKSGNLPELIIYQQNLFKLVGRSYSMF